jgi:hypothetical protein
MTQTNRINSFQAEDLFDRVYTIDIYADQNGRQVLRLRDGSLVREQAKGTYQIDETGLLLTVSTSDVVWWMS